MGDVLTSRVFGNVMLFLRTCPVAAILFPQLCEWGDLSAATCGATDKAGTAPLESFLRTLASVPAPLAPLGARGGRRTPAAAVGVEIPGVQSIIPLAKEKDPIPGTDLL